MAESVQSVNSGPGYAKHPDYRIDIEPTGKSVRIEIDGQVIVDSNNALLMLEQNHQPVYYFPHSDVDMTRFQRTDYSTHCPFKEDASYWTLTVAERVLENVMWSYETPCDEVAEVKEYVSFYRDRMDDWYEDGELILGNAHS